jgi:hypothetical protein
MLTVAPSWEQWSARVASARDPYGLRHALREVADEMAPYLGRNEISHAQWRRLGVHTAAVPLTASGGCRREGGELVVLVRDADDPRRQRFTVAHEIGHLLLSGAREHLQLARSDEEQLCNEFASALIIPRDVLCAELADTDRIRPADVVRLANRFGVTLQPLLIALRDHIDDEQVLIIALRAGHPKRPIEVAFRFHAAAANTVFLPRKQRLTSVGLQALDDFAERREARSGAGKDFVVLESRRDQYPQYGVARGDASWTARLLPNGLLIASLDASQLNVKWGRSDDRTTA